MKFKMTLLSLALAAVAGSSASGAIVWSGIQDIAIPDTFDGITLDIFTESTSSAPLVLTSSNVNFFFGGAGIQNGVNFQPVRTGTGNFDPVANLTPLDIVDSMQTFGTSNGGSGGPSSGSTPTHLGAGVGQFANASEGYIGFQANSLNGWLRVTLTNNGTGGVIHEWAYEDQIGTAIQVGAIPEPSSASLGLLGAFGLLLRRRRN